VGTDREPWRDGTTHMVFEPEELLERVVFHY